jgi:hypothetical protein
VNGTPANGNVTSTNLKTLSYTGFETGPIVITPPELPGDYNRDGAVDAADYTVWRKMLGTGVLQAYAGADGSGNYTIGSEDHGLWGVNFGETLAPPGAGSGASTVAELIPPMKTGPEAPVGTTSLHLQVGDPMQVADMRGANEKQPAGTEREPFYVELAAPLAPFRPAGCSSIGAFAPFSMSRGDAALSAWLSQPESKQKGEEWQETDAWEDEEKSSTDDAHFDSVDDAFALIVIG